MRKVLCDHCGKELDCKEDYTDINLYYANDDYIQYNLDLCIHCYNEIINKSKDLIDKFCNKKED